MDNESLSKNAYKTSIAKMGEKTQGGAMTDDELVKAMFDPDPAIGAIAKQIYDRKHAGDAQPSEPMHCPECFEGCPKCQSGNVDLMTRFIFAAGDNQARGLLMKKNIEVADELRDGGETTEEFLTGFRASRHLFHAEVYLENRERYERNVQAGGEVVLNEIGYPSWNMPPRPVSGPVMLPATAYPFRLQALHPETGEVIWQSMVERPPGGVLKCLSIPPLANQLGHPVVMRILWADGTISVSAPEAPATTH